MPSGSRSVESHCKSHYDCDTGYCALGTCRKPGAYTPCNPQNDSHGCPNGFTCHLITQHCYPDGKLTPFACKSSADCPWEFYCGPESKCIPRRLVGQKCTNHTQCRWQSACHPEKKVCILKCEDHKDCRPGEQCVLSSIPDVGNVGICLEKEKPHPPQVTIPAKVPSKVPTKIPNKVPTKIPSNVPVEAPNSMPTGSPTKLPTKGLYSYLYNPFAIAGGAILLMLVLAAIIFYWNRRSKKKSPSPNTLVTDFASTPSSPTNYQGHLQQPMVSFPISPMTVTPLPSYEEATSSQEGFENPTNNNNNRNNIPPNEKS